MAASDIMVQLLDGRQAAEHAAELQELRTEVYGPEPDGDAGGGAGFPRQFRVQSRQPGFALAVAWHGGYLVGYAAGLPLRPSTSWWRNLTAPAPPDITAEHPGRTFALVDLVVRASWRRQGVGRTLHDLLLRSREEERATLIVAPTAAPALSAFQNWGWRRVARTREPGSASPAREVLVTTLPVPGS